MPRPPRLRRGRNEGALLHEGLPPSFLPSMVMPSVMANTSTTIPSVDNASTPSASHINASQDTKRYLNASQDVGRGVAHASINRFRDMAGVRIVCDDWNNGEIFDWYAKQPHTTINKLELRKERDHFKHEYIIVYLDNGWSHRIERRPIKGASTETISKDGCEAEDGLTPINDKDLEVIRSETDAEITLEFPSNKPDLYNVIAVVVAIHLDPQTRNYTLQQYNCYFVARSIITIITRHCLLRAPLLTGLRWDRVTESAIFDHIFGGDYNKLATVMKASISAVLDDLLWDIIKVDAGMRLENNQDWDRLRDIVRGVIHEEVERSSATLNIHDVQRVVNKWTMDATLATLWHENLDRNLSDRRYTEQYVTTTEDAMKVALKPELVIHLPENMLKGLGGNLPQYWIYRIPLAMLIDLPPKMLAQVPVRLLEKLPDDLIAKLPYDAFRNAPAEHWQKRSVQAFSKASDAMVLTLPNNLNLVPQRLLEVSLQRMQVLLDQPKDHPGRVFALKLLRRLPQEQLTRLDPSYVAMCNSEAGGLDTSVDHQIGKEQTADELDASADHQMGKEQTADELVPTKPQRLPLGRLKKKWDEASFIGLMIRFGPMPILKRVPPRIMNLIPDSSLELIPTSALERLPKEYLAKISTHCFERLPVRLLHKVPESLLQKIPQSTLERLSGPFLERLPTEFLRKLPKELLQKMPRSTLERLSTSFLERLPTELLRKLPRELLDNLPEDLSDQIREAIQSKAFGGKELRQQLLQIAQDILGQTLVTSSGKLPATVVRVLVRANLRKRTNEKLLKHEDLQKHILGMTRVHSKMVAQVPLLGMSEESVYGGLHTKMEEIWQVMCLHPSMPGHS